VQIQEQKPPPIRRDLQIVPQYYRGELSYLAKDPVTLGYYRLGEVEYVVLKCFQKGMGVEQTQQEVKKKTGAEVSALDIYRFAEQLRSSNLLKSRSMEDVRRLAANKAKLQKQKVKQVLSNYLFLTIPLWDPDRVLDRLLPYFRLVWNKFFFACWLVLAAVGVWLIANNFSVLVADAFTLLSGWNLLILSAVIFSTKFVHEMGHALTCKKFGGEVHAIGPAFLVFQPCMFTDTTDAWLFPSKWDRIHVTAAGIIIEVMLASVASLVWVSSDPGLVKQIAYSTMVTCSVSTVLFNANPLLRFDGYYILSDLLEIPNLRAKGMSYLAYLFDRYVLGLKNTPMPAGLDQARLLSAIYGVARFLYRMLIILAIGFFLYSIFEPLGIFMWATSAYGMILMPIWKKGKRLAQQHSAGGVQLKYLVIIAAVLGASALLWFVPVDYSIDAPCVLAPTKLSVIRVMAPGRLERVLVRPGDRVTEGQRLAVMKNEKLAFRAAQLREQVAGIEARLRSALATHAADYRMQAMLKQKLEDELKQVQDQIARLVLRAPHEGVLVNLHRAEVGAATPRHRFVPFLEGDYDAGLSRFVGMQLSPGTGLMAVAATGKVVLKTFVYEYDVNSLKMGDPMVCVLSSDPLTELRSSVAGIDPVDVKVIENVGITLADMGYIPVKPTQTGEQRPLKTIYEVRSAEMDSRPQFHWGLTGKAVITFGHGPVGSFFFGRLLRGLRMRLQQVGS